MCRLVFLSVVIIFKFSPSLISKSTLPIKVYKCQLLYKIHKRSFAVPVWLNCHFSISIPLKKTYENKFQTFTEINQHNNISRSPKIYVSNMHLNFCEIPSGVSFRAVINGMGWVVLTMITNIIYTCVDNIVLHGQTWNGCVNYSQLVLSVAASPDILHSNCTLSWSSF